MILGYIPEGTSYHWLAVTLEKSCLWEKQTLVLDLGHPQEVLKGHVPILSLWLFAVTDDLPSTVPVHCPTQVFLTSPSHPGLPGNQHRHGVKVTVSAARLCGCKTSQPLYSLFAHLQMWPVQSAQPVGKVKVLSRSVLSYFLQPHGL